MIQGVGEEVATAPRSLVEPAAGRTGMQAVTRLDSAKNMLIGGRAGVGHWVARGQKHQQRVL